MTLELMVFGQHGAICHCKNSGRKMCQMPVAKKKEEKLEKQKIRNLLSEKTLDGPQFTNCGVDMFGSFIMEEGRKEFKRYGALHTCLTSRAGHIEITYTMDADLFIQTLRQFVARRKKTRVLHSDKGSNFLGAQKKL